MLIEQNAHGHSPPRQRLPTRNSSLSGDSRKRVEELVEAVVPFEVVDQVAEGDPSPDKHGRAAENLWITVNIVRERHPPRSSFGNLNR